MLEILKAILFGIVEGITEWLPISSTGHMLLVDELFSLKLSDFLSFGADILCHLAFTVRIPREKAKINRQRKKTHKIRTMRVVSQQRLCTTKFQSVFANAKTPKLFTIHYSLFTK